MDASLPFSPISDLVQAVPILATPVLGKALGLWLLFLGLVGALLALDLGVLHRKTHVIGLRESLWQSAGYILLAIGFGAWIWSSQGRTAGIAFLTGFFVEKSLALDNVFVIALLFGHFAVPPIHQHRVLFWGILGAIAMRGVMIALGAALVEEFAWVLLLFGAFLLATGVKMLIRHDQPHDPSTGRVIIWLRRHLNLTDQLHGGRFFVRQPIGPAGAGGGGRGRTALFATPLFLALVVVEMADLIFAVDSIPAIFAITTDAYLVFTSNIFAILGLRSLYFALAAMVHRFRYLGTALALVLIFIGLKIFVGHLVMPVDPLIALAITLALLAGGVLLSLWKTRAQPAPAT